MKNTIKTPFLQRRGGGGVGSFNGSSTQKFYFTSSLKVSKKENLRVFVCVCIFFFKSSNFFFSTLPMTKSFIYFIIDSKKRQETRRGKNLMSIFLQQRHNLTTKLSQMDDNIFIQITTSHFYSQVRRRLRRRRRRDNKTDHPSNP